MNEEVIADIRSNKCRIRRLFTSLLFYFPLLMLAVFLSAILSFISNCWTSDFVRFRDSWYYLHWSKTFFFSLSVAPHMFDIKYWSSTFKPRFHRSKSQMLCWHYQNNQINMYRKWNTKKKSKIRFKYRTMSNHMIFV